MTLAEIFFSSPTIEGQKRRCSKCKVWLPLTRDNWIVYRRVEQRNGEPTTVVVPKPYCKSCINENKRSYYLAKKLRETGEVEYKQYERDKCECCGRLVGNRKTVVVGKQIRFVCWPCSAISAEGLESARHKLREYRQHAIDEAQLDLQWYDEGYERAAHQGNDLLPVGFPPHTDCVAYEYLYNCVVKFLAS